MHINVGQIVYSVDGKAYRVSSTFKTAGALAFKLADLQGRPCPTPADFFPIDGTRMHFASILKFAYNKDITKIVNEMIEQAGLPTDPKMDWAKYLTKTYSANLSSITTDPDIQDEVIYRTVVYLLFERKNKNGKKVLENFAEKLKNFDVKTQKKPLAEQVSDYLKGTFLYYAKDHAKQDAIALIHPEEMSMEQPGDEGETYNILDTEEHATGTGEFEHAHATRDIDQFIEQFQEWVKTKETPKSAPNYAALLKIYWEQAQQSERGDVKISDLTQEWIRRTGLSFDSLKQYRDKLGSLIRDFVYENKAQLGNSYRLVDLLQHMFPPPPKAKARPAKASSDQSKQAMNAPQLSPEALDRMYRVQLEGLAQGDCEGDGTENCDCETCEAREELERLTGKQAAKKPTCPHCGSDDYGLMPTDFETAKCNKCGKNWEHGIVEGINDPKAAAAKSAFFSPEDAKKFREENQGSNVALNQHEEGYQKWEPVFPEEKEATPDEKAQLEEAVSRYSKELKKFPKGPTGMTPDATKATPEWQAAKRNYNQAFQALRNYNSKHTAADLGRCSCEWEECPLGHKMGGCPNPAAHMLEIYGYKTRYCQPCTDATIEYIRLEQGTGDPDDTVKILSAVQTEQDIHPPADAPYCDGCDRLKANCICEGCTCPENKHAAEEEGKPTLQKLHGGDSGFAPIAAGEGKYTAPGLRVVLAEDWFIYVMDETTEHMWVYNTEMWYEWGEIPNAFGEDMTQPQPTVEVMIPYAKGHTPEPLMKDDGQQLTLQEFENENAEWTDSGFEKESMIGHDFVNADQQAIRPDITPGDTGRVPHGRTQGSIKRQSAELAGRGGDKDDVRGAGDLWREEYYQSGNAPPKIATSVKVLPCCGSVTNHHKPDCKKYNDNFDKTVGLLKDLGPRKDDDKKKADYIDDRAAEDKRIFDENNAGSNVTTTVDSFKPTKGGPKAWTCNNCPAWGTTEDTGVEHGVNRNHGVHMTKDASAKTAGKWKVLIRNSRGGQREQEVSGVDYSSAERAVRKYMKEGEKVVSMTIANKAKTAAPAAAAPAAPAPAPAPPAPAPSANTVVAPPPGTAIALPGQQPTDDKPMRKTVPPELPGKKWHMTSKTASILEDAFAYFMEGKKDGGLADVFDERYTRTGKGEDKYIACSKLMMDFEYAFSREEDGSLSDIDNYREDAENALREIVGDDPNYSESAAPAAKEVLKSGQNTPEVEAEVAQLAQTHPLTEVHENCNPAYEHDQWWIICSPCGASWAVEDATGGQSYNGLDLEEVDAGDGSCQENLHESSTLDVPSSLATQAQKVTEASGPSKKTLEDAATKSGLTPHKYEGLGNAKCDKPNGDGYCGHSLGHPIHLKDERNASTEKKAWTDEDDVEIFKKFAGGNELYHGTSGSDIESIQTEGLDAGYGEDKFVYLTCIYEQAVSYARGSAEGQAADTFAIVVVNAAKIPKLKRIRTHEGIWTAPKVSPKAINRVDVYNVATGQKIASHKTPPLSDTQYDNQEEAGTETNAYSQVPERVKPDANSGIRGSNDGTYIYQAEMWCPTCAKEIAADIQQNYPNEMPADPTDEHSYDSDNYPKGPFFDEESDAPEHCAGCHIFLENPLTSHGQEYMMQMVDGAVAKGRGDEPHIKEWMDFYEYHPEEKNMEDHESSVASSEKEAAMDNKKAAISQPTSGEDEGFNVKVVYNKYGITLEPTNNLLSDVQGIGETINKPSIWELMEDFFTNGWEMVNPEDIGALTSGEIMSDQDGNIYWHERYQIEDMVEMLMNGEKVNLQYGGNLFEMDEGSEIAPPAEPDPNQMNLPLQSSKKEATGEMSQAELDANGREEWPMHYNIADALGAQVKPFDQYQGPYVRVPEGRLWVTTPEGAGDGAELIVWNEGNRKSSEPFMWDDENAAVDAALSVMDNPPANTLPWGAEREQGPDTSEVETHVPAGKAKDWTPTYDEGDKARLKGLGVKGSKKQAAPGDGGLQRDVQNQYENHPLIEMLWGSLKRDPANKDRVQTAWGTKTKQGLVLSVARAMKESPVSGE